MIPQWQPHTAIEPWPTSKRNVRDSIIEEFQKTIEDCDKALELNPSYTKAHHRKAKAYQGQSIRMTNLENNVKAYLSFK